MNQVMQCPLCSGEMTITPDLLGRDVRCPHCQGEIHVPGGPPPLSLLPCTGHCSSHFAPVRASMSCRAVTV